MIRPISFCFFPQRATLPVPSQSDADLRIERISLKSVVLLQFVNKIADFLYGSNAGSLFFRDLTVE